MTTIKASRTDLVKKARRSVLKIDVCAPAKHKIILSWPNQNQILYFFIHNVHTPHNLYKKKLSFLKKIYGVTPLHSTQKRLSNKEF